MGTGQQPSGIGKGNILKRRKLSEMKQTKQGRDALNK